MTILTNVADLGNNIKKISEDTGVDINTVQMAIGLMISGPVRLVVEYGKSMAIDSVAGEYIAKGMDTLANSLTAAAHDTSTTTIENWINSEKIKEIEQSNSENKENELRFADEVQKNKQGAEYLINAATGVIGVGVGKGASKGKDGDFHNEKNVETKVPDYVTRNDQDFSITVNHKGKPKAYINDDGDLVAANPEGSGSIQSHIRGGSEENTPYISTTDPKSTFEPTNYGGQQIEVDTNRLQHDINSGKLENIEIITPLQVQKELSTKLDEAQSRYNSNPSKKNAERLENAEKDLRNAIRDGECLIKGCVPSDYIKFKE